MKTIKKLEVAMDLLPMVSDELYQLRKDVSLGKVEDPKFKYKLAQECCDDMDTVCRLLNNIHYKTKEVKGLN